MVLCCRYSTVAFRVRNGFHLLQSSACCATALPAVILLPFSVLLPLHKAVEAVENRGYTAPKSLGFRGFPLSYTSCCKQAISSIDPQLSRPLFWIMTSNLFASLVSSSCLWICLCCAHRKQDKCDGFALLNYEASFQLPPWRCASDHDDPSMSRTTKSLICERRVISAVSVSGWRLEGGAEG